MPRVSRGNDLFPAQYLVLEAERGPSEFGEPRPHGEFVVEAGGFLIVDERLGDDEAIAATLEIGV